MRHSKTMNIMSAHGKASSRKLWTTRGSGPPLSRTQALSRTGRCNTATHWSGSGVVQPCPAILVGYLRRQFIPVVHNRRPPLTAAADGRCRRPLLPARLSGWSPATHAHSHTPAHRAIFTAGNPRIRAGSRAKPVFSFHLDAHVAENHTPHGQEPK